MCFQTPIKIHFSTKWPILIVLSCLLYAGQAQSELETQLKRFQELIKDVSDGKSDFEQRLSWNDEQPYLVTITRREISRRRGKETVTEFQFNAGLLDEKLIRYQDARNELSVRLRSSLGDVVKEYRDGLLRSYEKDAVILADGIDNARGLEEIARALVQPARAAWEQDVALPSDFSGLMDALQRAVAKVQVDEDTYEQLMEVDSEYPTRVQLTRIERNAKGTKPTQQFTWNLVDTHPAGIEAVVKGKNAGVEVTIRQRQPFVRVEEDGALKEYQRAVFIHTKGVDESQVLVRILEGLAGLATDIEQTDAVMPSEVSAINQAISESVVAVNTETLRREQRWEPSCQVQYVRLQEDDKKREELRYGFDLADVNPNSITIDVRRTDLFITLQMAERRRYIAVSKDGGALEYENNLELFVPDLPGAKRLRALLQKAVERCPQEVTPVTIQQVQQLIASVGMANGELTSTLTAEDETACNYTYALTEDTNRKVRESVFDLKLGDLDPDGLDLSVRSSGVNLVLPTRYREKIIKKYFDGSKVEYVAEFEMPVANVATGKILLASIREAILGCTE